MKTVDIPASYVSLPEGICIEHGDFPLFILLNPEGLIP